MSILKLMSLLLISLPATLWAYTYSEIECVDKMIKDCYQNASDDQSDPSWLVCHGMKSAGATDTDETNACSPIPDQYKKLKKLSNSIRCDHYSRIPGTIDEISPKQECRTFKSFGIPLNAMQVYKVLQKGFDKVRTKDWTSTFTFGFFGSSGCAKEIDLWCSGQGHQNLPEQADDSNRIYDQEASRAGEDEYYNGGSKSKRR